MKLFRKGSAGREVRDIQARLVSAGFLPADTPEAREATFGESTDRALRAFQQRRGLIADGIVGPDTWRSLVEASRSLGSRFLYLHEPPLRGDDVAQLKARLNSLGFYSGREDGIYDRAAADAVEQFQRNSGLFGDGIVGSQTVEALLRLSRVTKPSSVASVRESEKGLPSGGIEGRRIILDAGHGYPPDPGATGPLETRESEVAEAIVEMLGEELFERRAVVIYSRRRGEYFSDRERAARANVQGVDLLLSVHMNSSGDTRAGGSSCYYFASGNYRSPYGYRLANHIQDELVDTLRVQDCRTHGRTFPLLLETRMPVVIVEPVFITNPEEEERLRDESFLSSVARCIALGTTRYFDGFSARAEDV